MSGVETSGAAAPPLLAVVGHPNKGKSSIVATLAHDASVRIAPDPGTTVRTRHYPMRVEGQVLYTLADTPGFQRARRALAWMQAHERGAEARAEVVREFVEAHRDTDSFPDECELLAPIVDGAGILYVVDGSKPYGAEYEAEMEILRWSGRPRMALINPIGATDHVEAWRAALGQFFNVVRVFDAMTADFTRQIELLRAFGQLDEIWTPPFEAAIAALQADRAARERLAANALATTIADMLTLSIAREIDEGADTAAAGARLESAFQDALRERERRGRKEVERIFDHADVQRREADFELLEQDLFDEETWLLWGLSPTQLAVAGTVSGALAGLGIDAALGGVSLLLGTAIGAIGGGVAAWFGGDSLADVKVAGVLPLGGKRLRIGPTKSVNFPYVVLGRALHHLTLVAARSHAHRDTLDVTSEPGEWADRLDEDRRRDLERCFAALREDGSSREHIARLTDTIATIRRHVAKGNPDASMTIGGAA